MDALRPYQRGRSEPVWPRPSPDPLQRHGRDRAPPKLKTARGRRRGVRTQGIVAGLLLALLLPGCFAFPGQNCPSTAPFTATELPLEASDHRALAAWSTVFRTDVPVDNATLAPSVFLDLPEQSVTLPRMLSPQFGRLDAATPGEVALAWRPEDWPLCPMVAAFKTNVEASANTGSPPTAGQGAHVWYAGFWTNGTMFGTNIPTLDHSDWPRAGWYASSAGEPLRVYVYASSRSEEPVYWKSSASAYASNTPGTPLDQGAESAASAFDGAAGVGYYTTIKGFNDGLKLANGRAASVIEIAAKDAYTQPGREKHPLYGSDLVFLVIIQDVVPAPCPSPSQTSQLDSPCEIPPTLPARSVQRS